MENLLGIKKCMDRDSKEGKKANWSAICPIQISPSFHWNPAISTPIIFHRKQTFSFSHASPSWKLKEDACSAADP